MTHVPWQHRRSPPRLPRGAAATPAHAEGRPVGLDLLRADLYRLLDELARARAEQRLAVVVQFERAWEEFKQATAEQRGAED